jgi:hypothetical protein
VKRFARSSAFAVAVAATAASGCIAGGLPAAGKGSVKEARPTTFFPVAYNGEQAPAEGRSTAAADAPAPVGAASSEDPLAGLSGRQRVGSPQNTAFALVVGIERYRDIAAAPGAKVDAESMARVFAKTLGVPLANQRTLVDDHATRSDILQALDWLVASVPSGGRAYFYFSGHGTPGVKDASARLVPYEASDTGLEAVGIPLSDVMQKLAATKGKDALAIVDSCFSGAGGRSVLPKGARPLVRVKDPTPARKSGVALFAAASGSEISGPTKAGDRGLFTYYLVDGLAFDPAADADGDGQITLSELTNFVRPRVERDARKDGREQRPTVSSGGSVDPQTMAVVWGL